MDCRKLGVPATASIVRRLPVRIYNMRVAASSVAAWTEHNQQRNELTSKSSSQDHAQKTLLHITTAPMSLVFLRGQLAYMKDNGFDVHVMTSPGKQLEEFARNEGARAHPVAMQRRITPLRDLATICQMIFVLMRIRPDIVHASTPKGGLLGTIAARIVRVPVVVYHVRGLAFTGHGTAQRPLLKWTERIACTLAHTVLCVSESVRTELVSEGICASEKTVVLRSGSSNGVAAEERFDPAKFPPGTRQQTRSAFGIPENAVVVGFVGRLVRDKGIVELSEAWREVVAEFPGAWLLIIGPWENRDPVPAEVRQALENQDNVSFAGEQRDSAPFYKAIDLVVLPTYREGFPNVALEAAAMQLPVVVTNVTGCVDAVVDGVTGTFVPVAQAGPLAEAIKRYVRDPNLRRLHGNAGRTRVLKEFRPPDIWAALFAQYHALLARRVLRSPGDEVERTP